MPTWLQPFLTDVDWPAAENVTRIVLAIILGGVVGLEREIRDKPAGFRTIILICLGACMFALLSQSIGGKEGESTRIAAQVVTGIGFLGAGAIMHYHQSIVGLTTAATIWAVAAVGMAVGFGRIGLAIAGTAATMVALFLFDSVEIWIGKRRDVQDYRISTANIDGAFHRVLALFREAGLRVRKRSCYEDNGQLIVQVVAFGSKPAHEALHLRLIASEDYVVRRP
jgi:putative Mg2+ transporter-C (MgtC) family protein